MSTCNFSGNADMYGAGIRIGFYLQWLGTILAGWLAPSEVPNMRMSSALFLSATFLALILKTAQDALQLVEIYIVLLLTFATCLYFVPLYIWRFVTCCNARLDPSRFPKVGSGPVYSVLNFGLTIAVSVFQVWFWMEKVRSMDFGICAKYGFLFSKIQLDIEWFVALNAALYLLVLLICLGILSVTVFRIANGKWLDKVEDQEPEDDSYERPGFVIVLETVQTIICLLVASVVITATELTIRWNGIQDVGSVSSAGQMIPMVIGIGQVIRVIYLAVLGDVDKAYRKRVRGKRDDPIHAMNSSAIPGMPPMGRQVDPKGPQTRVYGDGGDALYAMRSLDMPGRLRIAGGPTY